MDAALAKELRVGDTVLYRNAVHTITHLAPWVWPPTFKIRGPYATESYVSHTLLHFPVLLNPPEEEDKPPC